MIVMRMAALRNKCVIETCRRVNKTMAQENEAISFFQVPQSSMDAYQACIPTRLSKSSRLCSRHFDDEDIFKGYMIQNVFRPVRWRLKPGAMPKHLLEQGPTSSSSSSLPKTAIVPQKSSNCKTPSKNLPVAVPRLLPKGRTNVQSSNICEKNCSLPVCGDVTHYIIVQDSLPTPHNSRTPPAQKSLSLNTSDDILPSSSIPLAQNESINTLLSNCDHDYALLIAQPVVAVEKDKTIMTASQIQESPDASSAAHDFDHSYGVRPTSSTPTVEETCLDMNLSDYHEFISDVTFPTAEWSWSFNLKKQHLMCSSHCMSDTDAMTIKTVKFLTKTKVQLFINGKPIIAPDLNLDFQRKAHLSNLIKDFHYRSTCEGIVEESLADVKVTDRCAATKEGNVWRSKECQGLTRSGVVCSKCRFLRKYLKKMKIRQPKQPKDLKELYRKKLKKSQRALRGMKSKVEKFEATVAAFRKERQKLIRSGFNATIKILNPKEQLVVKTMMAKAKVRPGRDDRLTAMRYDPEFIADSLLIKQKSSAVYKHLRSKGILPLPSEATLLRAAKKTNLGGLNSGQASPIHPPNQPYQSQNALDSDESIPSDLDQSTPRQQLDEDMENERSESPDFAVAMSPRIVLAESEEITVPITDEMIVEIYTVE